MFLLVFQPEGMLKLCLDSNESQLIMLISVMLLKERLIAYLIYQSFLEQNQATVVPHTYAGHASGSATTKLYLVLSK